MIDLKKFEDTLNALEKDAAELLKDKQHGQSPHAGSLRARLAAAVDSLEHHNNWLAQEVTVPITAAQESKLKSSAKKES